MRGALLYFILFIALACDNQKVDPVEDSLGLSYYPLKSGNIWTYKVEKQEFFPDGSQKTETFELKYRIIDMFEDSVYSLQVSRRDEPTIEWEIIGLYQTYRNKRIAVLNTGSVSYVKLSFPIELGRTWDGNALNSQEENTYTLDSIGNTFQYEDNLYEETVTVIQDYSVDPVKITSDNIAIEVYAMDVGLVFKEERNIDYKSCSTLYPECCTQNNGEKCFGVIQSGTITYQFLIEFIE